jgi:hypothetical protein
LDVSWLLFIIFVKIESNLKLIFKKTERIVKMDETNFNLNKLNKTPARHPIEHWLGAIRLGKEFNEHPIRFKRA